MSKLDELNYWGLRGIQEEQKVQDGASVVEKKVIKAYISSQKYLTNEANKLYSRYLSKTDMSELAVKRVLNESVAPAQLIELQHMIKTTKDIEIKKQMQDYLNGLAVKARITRLEELKAKSYLAAKQLADVQQRAQTDYYIDVINDAYKNASVEGIIQNNLTTPTKRKVEFTDSDKKKVAHSIETVSDKPITEFKELSTRYVKNILDTNWQGSNYSKRIWGDTDQLAKKLEDLFTVKELSGMSQRDMVKSLRKTFDVSTGVASRLIRTEANYVANQAKLKGWKEHGVKQYILIAVLDLRTSTICREKDHKVYDVDKAVCKGKDGNYPPFHPWCRTIAVAYFEGISLDGKRTVNDPITGKTFTMSEDSDYKDWEQALIHKHSKEELDNKAVMVKNFKSNLAQYKRMKSLIGSENTPETFDKFQDIKYNKDSEWEQLRLKMNLQKLLDKGSLRLDINQDKQLRHELNHESYRVYAENNKIKGKPIPSYFKTNVSDIQNIVNKHYLSGEIQRRNPGQYAAIIEIDKNNLAMAYSNDGASSRATNRFKIHISKNTTHVVPMYPKEG
ncbi:minor capsid protein [Dellaglioa algida]|uniref:minor capsid protein n=1 Tax=Dellaglioa algida TaxID=105612 RepID=UPI0024C4D688|nr:minor capsid protein [Dellaglioa algida]MDK1716624.1 minor capsid protein [Dellaglioa algida]MDK1721566.1 minor capsid protein [Dellaglioa algida]